MPAVARNGDLGSHGGPIVAITTQTYVNGRLVLTPGAIYYCTSHGIQYVVQGSPDVYAENKPVSRLGDLCSCGAVIATASPDTFANG
jgi:uncharacterized Zn-binding protein involved in type VI secretion